MRAAAGDATRLELLLREATAVLTADDGPKADTTLPAELLELYDRLQPSRTAI